MAMTKVFRTYGENAVYILCFECEDDAVQFAKSYLKADSGDWRYVTDLGSDDNVGISLKVI